MMRSLILLICLSISTCVQGYYNFRNMAVIIENIDKRLLNLRNYLDVEETNQLPTMANLTVETLNLTYSSFSNDIEMRLEGLENQLSLLENEVRQCPNRQPPAPPRNVELTTETIGNSSYVTLYWDSPSPEPFALYYQYAVYFTPTNKTGHPTGNGAVFSICSKEQDGLTITDLPPNQHFKINVASVVGPQYVGYGDATMLKTFDLIPAAPIINYAETKGPNEIMILYERGPSDATVLYFVVYYKNGTGYEESRKIFAGHNYTLDDLSEGTVYTIAIAAASDNGVGEKSNEIHIQTEPYLPPPPDSLTCYVVNSTALMFTWNLSPPGNGIIRYYEIVASIDGIVKKRFVSSDLTLNSTVMTNLQAAEQYYFVASSFTRRRKGPESVGFFCGTAAAPPGPPENIRYELLMSNPPKYRFTFRPPSKGQSEITGFSVTWGAKGSNGIEESIDLDSLSWESDFSDGNRTYTFKFTTINPAGRSKPVIINLETPEAKIVVPRNVKVEKKNETDNMTGKTRNYLNVTWSHPNIPVDQFQILYRYRIVIYPTDPTESIKGYVGRWILRNVTDPRAIGLIIPLHALDRRSYDVVVRAIPAQANPFNNVFNQGSQNPGRRTSPSNFNRNNSQQNMQNNFNNNPNRNPNPSSRNTPNINPFVNQNVNPNANPNINRNVNPNVNRNFNSNSNVNRNTNFNI